MNNGHVPTDWQWHKFGDVVDNFDGQRIPIKLADRQPGPYPYYGASGVIDYVADYIFDGEFLLISEDGANLLARTYPIAFKADGKFWVNNHAHIVRPKAWVDIDFLMYWFAALDISEFVAGAAQPKLSQSNLNKIRVPLPPLEEQKRIAAIIDEQMQAVEEARRAAEAELEAAEALTAAYLREVFESDEAKEWKTVSIGDVCYVTKLAGFEYTKYVKYVEEGEFIALRAQNIRNTGLTLGELKRISQETASHIERAKLKKYDIVMTFIGANIGQATWIDRDNTYYCAPNIAKIRPNHEIIDHRYLTLAIQSRVVIDQIQAINGSTAQPSLSMRNIRDLYIALPSLERQTEIAEAILRRLSEVDNLLESITNRIDVISALPTAILRRAFSGGY